MKNLIGWLLFCLILTSCQAQKKNMKTISQNKMAVKWHYDKERVYFEMSAPTTGWVTIGFNTNSGLVGSSLLMGNIINGNANVVEHYTLSLGNYKSIQELGRTPTVKDITGYEINGITRIKFSIRIKSMSMYQKDLESGMSYSLILAYSRADDFQHHSMMRTSMKITL